MKSDFHFHFYSRIVIMAVLAVSIIFIQQSVRSTAQMSTSPPQDYDYEINGWAWAASAGWLSLNCYNDFDVPGEYMNTCYVPGSNPPTTATGIDYGLGTKIVGSDTELQGCAWAGNALNSGGDALGWVCFSDPFTSSGPSPDATISDRYLNALDPTTFASILSQENWKCIGTTGGSNDGDNCLEDADCPGGSCFFNDDGAWQLGFPISSIDIKDSNPGEPDLPIEGNPIEGCFNCYEEDVLGCASSPTTLCTVANEETVCGEIGSCVVVDVLKNCDNCLEYFYYPGRCELPTEVPGDSGTYGTHSQCDNDDDCTATPDTEYCQPISTCYYNVELDCTDLATVCSGGASECIPRSTGTLKKLIGAYECSGCNIESYDNICGTNTYKGNLNSCGTCVDTFYTPGVMLDNKHNNLAAGERAAMCGWAWNSWDDGNKHCSISGDSCIDATDCLGGETCELNIYGLGWFQFGPRVVTSTQPYLSIEGGSIYSKGDIRGRYLPPFGHYNASYLIESGGSITNFVSNSTLAGGYQGEFSYRPTINFPGVDSEHKYTNALGSIDYYGLTEDFSGTGSNINKYGSSVEETTSLSEQVGLGAKVFHYLGHADIPYNVNPINIATATGIGNNASGVIAVEGDLTIARNVVYGTANVDNLKHIPSLVWLIKGDLIIDPAVTELAGTFVVLGDGTSCAIVSPATSPPNHCGQIITCNGTEAECDNNNPLTIFGNVLAKYFDLGRLYTDPATGEASERFINDGRIQANPPPGFEDFSNVIPRFSEN
jgi:hypothetical protein